MSYDFLFFVTCDGGNIFEKNGLDFALWVEVRPTSDLFPFPVDGEMSLEVRVFAEEFRCRTFWELIKFAENQAIILDQEWLRMVEGYALFG